jgi:hypothetical protein
MKITQKFNRLTFPEYVAVLDRHEDYSDFNLLGLFRSILENDKLDLEQKQEIRALAISKFPKQFEFLQLKDPHTYLEIEILGRAEVTIADRSQLWKDIVANQQKILATKKIKHRNFGNYSKHDCGYESCPYNGIMIKRGSYLSEGSMRFPTDEHKYSHELKVGRQRKSKRDFRDNISQLDLDYRDNSNDDKSNSAW